MILISQVIIFFIVLILMINHSEQSYDLSNQQENTNRNIFMQMGSMQDHPFHYHQPQYDQKNPQHQHIQIPQNSQTFQRHDFFDEQQPEFAKPQYAQHQQSLNIAVSSKREYQSRYNSFFERSEGQQEDDFRNQSKQVFTPGTQLKDQEKLRTQLQAIDNDEIIDLVLRNNFDQISQKGQSNFDSELHQQMAQFRSNAFQKKQGTILKQESYLKQVKAPQGKIKPSISKDSFFELKRDKKIEKHNKKIVSQEQYLPYLDQKTRNKRKRSHITNQKVKSEIKNQQTIFQSQKFQKFQIPQSTLKIQQIIEKRQKISQIPEFQRKILESNFIQNLNNLENSKKAQQILSKYENSEVKRHYQQSRAEKIYRYLEKKKRRVWQKKVSYHCRKQLAESRPRVNGRFAKKEIKQPQKS